MNLTRIAINGYKSIKECDLPLGSLNILIGANGAGKSNFISFFKMLPEMPAGRMRIYVGKQGGADDLLTFGRKVTSRLHFELESDQYTYKADLEPTHDDRLLFVNEGLTLTHGINTADLLAFRQYGNYESHLADLETTGRGSLLKANFNLRAYHFPDTGVTSPIKRLQPLNDNEQLASDAANLAPFLLRLKTHHPGEYQNIIRTVRLIAPFFDDFHLRPSPDNKDMIELEWKELGADRPFKAYLLSDGTLRFICLAVLLMQPPEFQPATILIDEPELGLHPAAIHLLAAMLRSAARGRQLIVATQSTDLLDECLPEEVIVADRTDNGTMFHRLDGASLEQWLQEYSLGELWQKNILGGRPL